MNTSEQIAIVKKKIADLDRMNQELVVDDDDLTNLRQKLQAKKKKVGIRSDDVTNLKEKCLA
jgi:hypothetical protein